jgi:hypothetical protein
MQSDLQSALLTSPHLHSRQEVLTPGCVPRTPGVYAWFFREVPPLVPPNGCIVRNGLTLLYAGIARKAPPKNGTPASEQTLWHRIRYHMRGNAYGSTLRLTLGCLLAEPLGIELRRVASGKRRTFAEGEVKLSAWMEENAFVCWMQTREPWTIETQLITSVGLPLNLDQNRTIPSTLRCLRSEPPRSDKRMNCRYSNWWCERAWT